jgi:hypothetical protein
MLMLEQIGAGRPGQLVCVRCSIIHVAAFGAAYCDAAYRMKAVELTDTRFRLPVPALLNK